MVEVTDSSSASASSPESQSKKRRIRGACDICKRKKVRCDSGAMHDNRCSNCLQFGFECTHWEVARTLGPAKGYVESLEARLEKMDKLLNKLLPGTDVNQEVAKIDTDEYHHESVYPNSEDEPHERLVLYFTKVKLNPQENRFFGKSSGHQLIQTALDFKQEYIGDTITLTGGLRRTEFWRVPEWVTKNPELENDRLPYVYPDADLIPSLIDAYFLQFNPFLPLLHRPTFEKSVAEGLHLSDSMFGATLLLVCAHGSRYSDDPRVLADNSDNPRSAGWKWFEQVNVYRTSLYKRTSLYELQMHVLHVLFTQSSETPEGVWTQIGFALRLSQEVGAHRRRRKKDEPPSTEDELWKRAFWVLLSLDRIVSSLSGLSCGLNDEDFDLDLPLECDDEYWDKGFQQPPGNPSSIAFFNCFLRLMDILAYAMRLIYPIRRANNKFVNGPPRSEQQVIAQLDSAMNNWMDKVPSHLQWNPECENTVFAKQSAALYATYYYLQIFIHRPFIPSPRNPGPSIFPSLAICTNAARSCSQVLESLTRWNALPYVSLQMTAFTAAIILLLNIWSGKRSGYTPNPHRELQGVQRCIEALRVSEKKWASAGRLGDIIRALACAGELAILDGAQYLDSPNKKRPREEDIDLAPPQIPSDPSRSMAGMRPAVPINDPSYIPQQQHPANFSWPKYSNELEIHSQSKISDSVPCMPFQRSDDFFNLVPGPMVTSPNIQSVYYGTNASFADQMMESPGDHNQVDNHQMSANFTAHSTGNPLDFDSSFCFNTMPAMDNATMAMWSAAPTNFEMDDWNSYIHSFEQMTQAQGDMPTHGGNLS